MKAITHFRHFECPPQAVVKPILSTVEVFQGLTDPRCVTSSDFPFRKILSRSLPLRQAGHPELVSGSKPHITMILKKLRFRPELLWLTIILIMQLYNPFRNNFFEVKRDLIEFNPSVKCCGTNGIYFKM
jgi:hypothetical protein